MSRLLCVQARTTRRSSRSHRLGESAIPADSTAVLRDPHPRAPPTRLHRRAHPDHAAGPSSGNDQEPTPDTLTQTSGHIAPGRQTRSRKREQVEPSAAQQHHDLKGGEDAAVSEQQQQHGRSLRSKRVKIQEPSRRQVQEDSSEPVAAAVQQAADINQPAVTRSTRAQSQGASQAAKAQEASDAQMASAWQERYDNDQPVAGPRRSSRAQSQAARSQEGSAEGNVPGHPTSGLSPVSNRQTRARHRSEAEHLPDSPAEPLDIALASPSDGSHAVRRSQRQHHRAASGSVDTDSKTERAAQGSTGIRITLRPAVGGTRQTLTRGRMVSDGSGAPSSDLGNGHHDGLRVNLRPRKGRAP